MLKCHLPVLPILRFLRSPQLQSKKVKALNTVRDTLLAVALIATVSGVLTAIAHPQISPLLVKVGLYFKHPLITMQQHSNDVIIMLNYVSVGALVEELYTRLFALPLIIFLLRGRRGADVLAVFLTAALWSLAHSGMIIPEWYKFTQVFVVGIILGFLFLRRGIEATIITHVIINVSGALFFSSTGGS